MKEVASWLEGFVQFAFLLSYRNSIKTKQGVNAQKLELGKLRGLLINSIPLKEAS
jgi:hypothetical protein